MTLTDMIIGTAVDILTSEELWGAAVILVAALLCWMILRRIIQKGLLLLEKNGRAVRNPDAVFRPFKYLLFAIFGTALLNVFGVDLSSLLAGLGLAGVVVGFAVQDILKDVTMGANIIADKYYSVGDIVSIGNVKNARVLHFNMKTTRLEDLDTGSIITIANRNISEAAVLSDWQFFDLPAPYEESAARMRALCLVLCERIRTSELVTDCSFLGTQLLADSAVYYRLLITGDRQSKGIIRRYAIACLQDLYAEEGIAIPYPHMDIEMDIRQQGPSA